MAQERGQERGAAHAMILVGLSTIVWLIFVFILQAGVSTPTALLWVFTILCGAAGAIILSRRFPNIPKSAGWLAVGASALLLLIIIFTTTELIQQVIPICGDGYCAMSECTRGCADCSSDQCQDGTCTTKIESCATSEDCACDVTEACDPNRKDSSERGCAPVTCGDNYCDRAIEDTTSCCIDCGCQPGFHCEQNACFFQPPVVTLTPYFLTHELSATSIAANPHLTNSTGGSRPLMAVRVHNSVVAAQDMSLMFSIADVVTSTYEIGTLGDGAQRDVLWYLPTTTKALGVTQRSEPNITVTLRYIDTQGVRHSSTWRYPFVLLSRNSLDSYGNITLFVTPADVQTSGTTPAKIWDELREQITIGPQTELIQFPAETLAYHHGSQTDMALLYVSALERQGLRPALVESADGILVRVRDDDRFVMLNPRLVDKPFNEAIVSTPGYVVYDVIQSRLALNATTLALGADYIPGSRIAISRNVEQSCVCTDNCPPAAFADYVVRNNGRIASPLCGTSVFTLDGEVADIKTACFTLQPNEEYLFRHGYRGEGVCRKISTTFSVQNATG